jgi:hypothetical protein
MLRPVILASALVVAAGSTLVYAQQRSGDTIAEVRRVELRHRPTAQDLAAFTDARIAALKAGLQLTPDQAKNWPQFETALRELAQLRTEHRLAREKAEADGTQPLPESPFERLTKRADNIAKFGAALKHVADAGAPLYQSLDDAQKQRFKQLSHLLRPHHRHFAAFWHGGRESQWGSGPQDGERGFGHRHFRDGDGGWQGGEDSRL